MMNDVHSGDRHDPPLLRRPLGVLKGPEDGPTSPVDSRSKLNSCNIGGLNNYNRVSGPFMLQL